MNRFRHCLFHEGWEGRLGEGRAWRGGHGHHFLSNFSIQHISLGMRLISFPRIVLLNDICFMLILLKRYDSQRFVSLVSRQLPPNYSKHLSVILYPYWVTEQNWSHWPGVMAGKMDAKAGRVVLKQDSL